VAEAAAAAVITAAAVMAAAETAGKLKSVRPVFYE
jgi:hypothetical protein